MDVSAVRTIWLMIGIALILRLWGTWYGLPYSYWVDEYHEVMRAMELGAGGFNFNRTTKGGFYYLLFVEYGIYFIILKFTGAVNSTRDFAEAFVRDPSAFYLMGRATAAVLGTATVFIVCWLGRRAWSVATGILAAAIVAVNLLHTDLSRIIGVDVPMVMLIALSLYFAQGIVEAGRRSDYVLSALCAGLATTTKLPAILVLLPLLIAHSCHVRSQAGGFRSWLFKTELWQAVLVFLVVLVATNPGIVGNVGNVTKLFVTSEAPAEDVEAAVVSMAAGERPNLYFFYVDAIADSMGWPLFLVAVVSVGYAAWKRTPTDLMLLSYAAVHYLAIASTISDTLYYPRYALPIMVVLALLSGRALADVIERWTAHRAVKTTAMLGVLFAWPVWQSAQSAYALTQTDTRTLAKDWIEANVPPGSHVLIEGLKIAPIKGTAQLNETHEGIEQRIDQWRRVEPKQARFLELQLTADPLVAYRLTLVDIETVRSPGDYRSEGVEYFVVRPDFFAESRRTRGGSAQFIMELRADPSIARLMRFEGSGRTPPGPTIEVYGPRGE